MKQLFDFKTVGESTTLDEHADVIKGRAMHYRVESFIWCVTEAHKNSWPREQLERPLNHDN